MNKNKLFSESQSKFGPGCSINLQLLSFLEEWTDHLDNSFGVGIMCFAFTKALNPVLHKSFFRKSENRLSWLTKYSYKRLTIRLITKQEIELSSAIQDNSGIR